MVKRRRRAAKEAGELPVRTIRQDVTKILLPHLIAVMRGQGAESLGPQCIHLCMPVVRLLRLLKGEEAEQNFAQILTILCNMLAERQQETRNVAREALCQAASVLGPRFFHHIVKELYGTLRKGYAVHVLGYTVNVLIKQAAASIKPGQIDNAALTLTKIFNREIFGRVAEQKHVKKIATSMIEARDTKSFESYEFLARIVSFGKPSTGFGSISSLMTPIAEILKSSQSADVLKHCGMILQRVSAGLMKNKSVRIADLLPFLHLLVTSNAEIFQPEKPSEEDASLDERQRRWKTAAEAAEARYLLPPNPSPLLARGAIDQKSNAYLFAEFALDTLHELFLHNKLHSTDQKQMELLDPFVQVIANCILDAHPSMVVVSLKCLLLMTTRPLPSLTNALSRLSLYCLKMLRDRFLSGAVQVTCIQLLRYILEKIPRTKSGLNDKALARLIDVVAPLMPETDKQEHVFALLEVVLLKKVVIQRVYDLVDQVSKLLVTSPSEQVRDQCGKLLLLYFLHYPSDDAMRNRRINFLLNNLKYEYTDGRMAVLNMLLLMLTHFPEEELQKCVELVFPPLVLTLANEKDPALKQKAATCVSTLIRKADGSHFARLYDLVSVWLSQSDNLLLRSAATQALSFFVLAGGKRLGTRLANLAQVVLANLQLPQVADAQWELAYLSLKAVEKAAGSQPVAVLAGAAFSPLWPELLLLLRHGHTWVQQVSSRVLAMLLARHSVEEVAKRITGVPVSVVPLPTQAEVRDTLESVNAEGGGKECNMQAEDEHEKDKEAEEEGPDGDKAVVEEMETDKAEGQEPQESVSEDAGFAFLCDPERLFTVADALAWQLSSENLTKKAADQIVKNLVFIGRVFYAIPDVPRPSRKPSEEQGKKPEEKKPEEKKKEAKETEDKKMDEEQDEAEEVRRFQLIHWLVRRLSYIARQRLSLQRNKVFLWFGAMASFVSRDDLYQFLVPMLSTLVRCAEDTDRFQGERSVAIQVMDLLRRKVGGAKYLEVYSTVKERIMQVRSGRRQRRREVAIASPERFTKIKAGRVARARVHRAKKMELFREFKPWTGKVTRAGPGVDAGPVNL
eukprot:TRINITY_DN677_c0_g1_i1.p1 TRINITY_DN677_c0_g1~~TRINITY_DN677_c0_g1_i1.p1  ORF type:complete len:1077 (+),score=314.92 TRINITY_DN677_c0_g1_i1:159-3389(+)